MSPGTHGSNPSPSSSESIANLTFGAHPAEQEEFRSNLRQYPSLWNPTAGECARYWLETYPAGTHLHLEPSIWQDYPGSFS